MRLYLIRHGETDLNKHKILQGRSDHELNEYGRELARITGKALKDITFDAVYTSPLKRAKETALLFISENSALVKPPIIEDERIQEISFGDFEGKCYGKDNFNMPDETFLNFFDKPEAYNTPPNGESFDDILKRVSDFLQEIISDKVNEDEENADEANADKSNADKANADKTILISTHGCALKAILANIRNTPISEFWGEGVHKNCAVSIVDVEVGVATVIEDGKLYY